jgi:hypothetical protein
VGDDEDFVTAIRCIEAEEALRWIDQLLFRHRMPIDALAGAPYGPPPLTRSRSISMSYREYDA